MLYTSLIRDGGHLIDDVVIALVVMMTGLGPAVVKQTYGLRCMSRLCLAFGFRYDEHILLCMCR